MNEAPAERKAKLIWGGVIVGFLSLELVMCLVAATLATGDPSFAVVPGYHERALAWDETIAERRASDDLGWNVAAGAGAPDVLGTRTVTLLLEDQAGASLTGAAVEVTLFHHARAGEVRTLPFIEAAPGTYTASTEMRRGGLWELRIDAKRGSDHFVAVLQLELATGGKD